MGIVKIPIKETLIMEKNKFISGSKCTHPSQLHTFEVAPEEDQRKGYAYKCSDCGLRFHLIDEEQMEELLDFMELDVDFISIDDN